MSRIYEDGAPVEPIGGTAYLVLHVLIVVPWVFGIAVALSKGFWMTVLAILLPPAAWVMVAQRMIEGCSA